MFSGIDASASGLTAQRLRMDIIADNIANVNTTETEEGTPYRRKLPVFRERSGSFSSIFKEKYNVSGVEVAGIKEDNSPFKIVYRPHHPQANEEGYLALPNIDITSEMVDMIEASRAYEANVTALNTSKNMAMKALEIGKG